MSEEAGAVAVSAAWTPREHVGAFYSGHSLSEGVPEAVEQIARSLGQRFEFEIQVLGYSLLRQRTKGEVPSATGWPGYRAGSNREGSGLDVAAELRRPRRLGSGGKYDVLVVTERHDLPAVARTERTAFHLVDMATHLLAGNSDAEVLLYHTWLDVDPSAPGPWIDYERTVSAMWECVASRANLDLAARGDVPRVRVLPGGGALAELVSGLWQGTVPGVAASDPGARVRLLFSDSVHLSDVGRHFMALLHYAIIFARSPEGAAIPLSIQPEFGRYMQSLAWRYALSYGRSADTAARRDMGACRRLMQETICPAYATYRSASKGPVLGTLKRLMETQTCRSAYGDARDAENLFASR